MERGKRREERRKEDFKELERLDFFIIIIFSVKTE